MKTEDLLILGAVALLGFVAWKVFKGTGTAATGRASVNPYTSEINNTALPGDPGWGWQYFSDGTAIGPDGSYYTNGKKVWSPT